MNARFRHALAASSFALILLVGPRATAFERRFVWNEESAVLSPGSLEVAPATTLSFARERYYSRFDERLGFQWGVLPKLHTTFSLNTLALTRDEQDPASRLVARVSSFEFDTAASEWKYQFSDPIVDGLGSALLFEAGIGPERARVLGRGALDKQFGALLLVLNAAARYDLEFERDFAEEPETETSTLAEADLGVGYFVTPRVLLGLELQNTYLFADGGFESSVLYGGPTFSVAADRWWASIGAAPQLVAIEGASDDSHLELSDNEKLRVRLLLGFEL